MSGAGGRTSRRQRRILELFGRDAGRHTEQSRLRDRGKYGEQIQRDIAPTALPPHHLQQASSAFATSPFLFFDLECALRSFSLRQAVHFFSPFPPGCQEAPNSLQALWMNRNGSGLFASYHFESTRSYSNSPRRSHRFSRSWNFQRYQNLAGFGQSALDRALAHRVDQLRPQGGTRNCHPWHTCVKA